MKKRRMNCIPGDVDCPKDSSENVYSWDSKEEGKFEYSAIGQSKIKSAKVQPMVYDVQTPKGKSKTSPLDASPYN